MKEANLKRRQKYYRDKWKVILGGWHPDTMTCYLKKLVDFQSDEDFDVIMRLTKEGGAEIVLKKKRIYPPIRT